MPFHLVTQSACPHRSLYCFAFIDVVDALAMQKLLSAVFIAFRPPPSCFTFHLFHFFHIPFLLMQLSHIANNKHALRSRQKARPSHRVRPAGQPFDSTHMSRKRGRPDGVQDAHQQQRRSDQGNVLQTREQVSIGLLPADLPGGAHRSIVDNIPSSAVNVGLTAGLAFVIFLAVTLSTVLFCVWFRKRMLRRRRLDCRKSPWTARYRQQEPHVEARHSAERVTGGSIEISDPSVTCVSRSSQEKETAPVERPGKHNSVAALRLGMAKRRTKMPDVWSSPVLPMPQYACASPRMRSMHIGDGQFDVVRQSPLLHCSIFPKQEFPSSHCTGSNMSNDAGQPISLQDESSDSSVTLVGLGLHVVDTAHAARTDGEQYAICSDDDDDMPIEVSPDDTAVWRPLSPSLQRGSLVCSADKYAGLMPHASITRRRFDLADRTMSASPSEESIYTAASLAAASEGIPVTVHGQSHHDCPSYASFAFLTDSPSHSKREQPNIDGGADGKPQQCISPCQLLDEIFDERDAKVSRNFVAAMRTIKRHLSFHAVPNVLARRSEIRRRTRTQADSNALSASVTPFAADEAEGADVNDQHMANDYLMRSGLLAGQVTGQAEHETAFDLVATFVDQPKPTPSDIQHSSRSAMVDFRLPSRTATTPVSSLPGTPTPSPAHWLDEDPALLPRKLPVRSATAIATAGLSSASLRTAARRLLQQERQHPSRRSTSQKDELNSPSLSRKSARSSTLAIFARSEHRRSYSLDSCLSTAILSYLHPAAIASTASAPPTPVFVPPTTAATVSLHYFRARAATDAVRKQASLTHAVQHDQQTSPLRLKKAKTGTVRCAAVERFRRSDSSTGSDYASPTMQLVALYDGDDETDRQSTASEAAM